QRKSSKAKEKKQRRLEERAAMAAVCAKVEAANKVIPAADPAARGQQVTAAGFGGKTGGFGAQRAWGSFRGKWGWCWGSLGRKWGRFWDEMAWVGGNFGQNQGWFWGENGAVLGAVLRQNRMVLGLNWGDLGAKEQGVVLGWKRGGETEQFWGSAPPFPPSTQMKKVMLTVFKHNHGAYQFFREALQFEVDATSPSVSGCCGDDSSYEILSRSTRFGDPHPGGGPCGGCCH
ncbi:NAA40 acetyltransferase, partial [Menura novaehollandiae]|nr:NAA40 acetyltransferase [Menura novaehollandiae]